MKHFVLLVIITLISLPAFIKAQDQSIGGAYRFEYISYGEGIYLNSRDEVYQDAQGTLWIPRADRLAMYDGRTIMDYPLAAMDGSEVKDVELSVQLTDDLILLLSEDAKVDIWSTEMRSIVDHITIPDSIKVLLDKIYHPDETGSLFPMSVVKSNDGDLIYALLRNINQDKFYLLRSTGFDPFEVVLTFDASQAMDLEVSPTAIYLSLADQVLIYGHDMQLLDTREIRSGRINRTFHLELDDDDLLWIYDNCNSTSCEVYTYRLASRQLTEVLLPEELEINPITKLKFIDNHIWIMGVRRAYDYNLETGEVVAFFDDIERYLASLDVPPTISHFTGISKSSDGYVWLSSGYGVLKLSEATDAYNVEMRSDDRFCPSFCSMRGITEDEYGNLYISYYSGIVKKDVVAGELSEVPVKTPIPANSSYSLNYNKGHLYWNDIKINLTTGEAKELISNKDNGHVTNVIDDAGQVWLSTCYQQQELLDLYRYNSTTDIVTKIDLPLALRQGGQATGMALSEDGDRLYMTTARVGAFYLDLNNNQPVGISGVPSQLYSIIEDSHGLLWMGGDSELISYDPVGDKVISYSRDFFNREGLLTASAFYSIIEDSDGEIWCGTSIGLVKLDRSTGEFVTYESYGDIGTLEFNRESYFSDRNGILYLGTVNGLYSFDPDKLSAAASTLIEYPINITLAQKFSGKSNMLEKIKLEGEEAYQINLSYSDKLLELRYTIPFFSSYQNVVYNHKLEGFNDNWSVPTETGQVLYTNLLPGDYKLRLRGAISNSATEAQEITIAIHVAQAWYRTIWFYLGLIAVIAAGFYGLYWYRLSQILKIQQLRTKISQDLHDDVGSTLTGVAMQSELLEMTVGDNYKEVTHNIATKSRYAMSQMRDIVWAMDANKDSVRDLIDRMRDHVDDALGAMGIDYNYKDNVQDESILLKPNVRQAVYLICKESITNITKHSDATHVKITFGVSRKKIELLIKDNGSKVGEAGTSGQGLTSMRNRALTIGGVYRFDYDDDGYQTSLVVPR